MMYLSLVRMGEVKGGVEGGVYDCIVSQKGVSLLYRRKPIYIYTYLLGGKKEAYL